MIATSSRRRLRMRGVDARRARPRRRRRTIAGVVAGVRADRSQHRRHGPRRVRSSDVVPFAVFNLLPVLGAVIVLGVGLLALATQPPEGHRPAAVRLLRCRARWSSACSATLVYHVGDAQLDGHRLRRGRVDLRRLRRACSPASAASRTGARSCGAADRRQEARARSRCSACSPRCSPRCRTTSPASPSSPPDATQFDYDGPQDLWNILVARRPRADGADGARRSSAWLSPSFRKGALAGDDPWDGQTLEWATASPAPVDNFAEVHTVASAEPLLDLKPTRRHRSRRDRLMLALPAAPRPRRAASCSSAPRSCAPPAPRCSAACWRCTSASATTPSRGPTASGVPTDVIIPEVRHQRDAASRSSACSSSPSGRSTPPGAAHQRYTALGARR